MNPKHTHHRLMYAAMLICLLGLPASGNDEVDPQQGVLVKKQNQ